MDPLLLQRGRTFCHQQRDFADWHQGRPWYLLWALDLDLPALRRYWQVAQQQLAPLLRSDYRRQPHLTLGVCGFAAAQRHRADDCDAPALQQQMRGLAAAAVAPFAVQLGAPDSFAAAPYLAVQDDGSIGRLRHALQLPPQLQQVECYVPHLTLGLYRAEWPLLQVCARLQPWLLPPLALPVQRVSLMAYQSHDVGGPLRTLLYCDLAGQRWHWQADAWQALGLPPLQPLPA